MQDARPGLTLIEVIVAILLFSIGSLGLAAASATVLRQITASTMRSRSAFAARIRDETAHSRPCSAVSSGSVLRYGLSEYWTVEAGQSATIEQTIKRGSVFDVIADRFESAIPCD
jgi:prepilin-type N-terminal cleavage/methylation domain-containing protein